ncbi:MAG: outer membrane protein assembly factor BamA [Deltaproteobacteria bacterium]|nr:outer membrane protein assembly factor BamA [Deltaproteobacteria bacterium]
MRLDCLSAIVMLTFWLVLAVFSGMSQAENGEPGAPRVAVLPFEINASPDLQYLREGLPELIIQELVEAGIPVVPFVEVKRLLTEHDVQYLDLAVSKDMALLSGAQYALYGSFSQVGESLSIDARLVEAFGLKEPKALFAVRKGLINLLPAVKDLATEVRLELLRKERIAEIRVEGNRILDKDVVLMRLSIQKGDDYTPERMNQELRSLYSLGYFDDILIKAEDLQDGKLVTFEVREKPLIQAIGVEGAEAIDSDDILKAMSSKAGSVINPKVLADDMTKIREMYRKDGYYNAKVSYDLEQTDPRQARLMIKVDEGQKLYIKEIRIEGAERLDVDDLRDQLALKVRGMFSWLTGTGVLKEELLDRDAAALEAYYGNRGFMDVKVAQPEVQYHEDGITIVFKVSEGARYRVGEVTFRGDMLESPDRLKLVTKLDDLEFDAQGWFDRSKLREDLQGLADYYADFGYAFAESDVDLRRDEESLTIDVAYIMSTGPKIYVRRVKIQGNEKTRDNVIRREMRLADGDVFRGYGIRRSNQRLVKLDFFETVNIESVPTPEPHELDLVVQIKEKTTGRISAGAGYSTIDKVFITGGVEERNLFGKGYSLTLSGMLGAASTRYDLTFWNPRVYDTELGAGATAYIRNIDYFSYDKKAIGGIAKFAYPLGEYTYLSWNYRIEEYRISNIDDDATDWIKDREGKNLASAVYAAVTRDTTDRRLNPSTGTINRLSVEYAGGLVGGDDQFVKYIYDSSYYRPLWWDTVFHWHGQVGYVMRNGADQIPDFERFYLGGMDSVRGYKGLYISPRNDEGTRIGGNKEFFTNFEYLFPLNKDIGLVGLLFFDAGQSWDDDEWVNTDLYKSVGTGIRWYSPLGPLRLELGYALDRDNKAGGGTRLEFSIGQFY